MTTQLYGKVIDESGSEFKLNLFATINKLRPDLPDFTLSSSKENTLKVSTKSLNGNTYQSMTSFFDKVTGRAGVKRAEAESIAYTNKELNYEWVNKNIIQKQCILCHSKGTQHDFSNYQGLIKKINFKSPKQSHLYGMLKTQSMPPFPLPTVSEKMQEAVLKWIEKGAPK